MRVAAALLAVLLASGCRSTIDSLGYNDFAPPPAVTPPPPPPPPPPPTEVLHPVMKPASYPVPLKDLGLTTAQITMKIQLVWNQLFHGDAGTQAIYVVDPADSSRAYILDVLHGQQRTEGQGLGMMFCVQLDHQPEFDNLWRYAKTKMQVLSGPTSGYFNSSCDSANQMTSAPCLDPFGLEQFLTALIFAHDRWGSAGAVDYQTDALALFHTIRHAGDGAADAGTTVTNLFDAATNLPYALPDSSYAGQTRPSIVMPGYYNVWAQATLDPVFGTATVNGRTLLNAAANAKTGLTPIRATFQGAAVSGWAVFDPEAYRTQINMVIDQFWGGGTTFTPELNRLLTFFSGQQTTGTSYALDGTVINGAPEQSLVIANAVAAGASTNSDRLSYLSALWNMPVTTGSSRYFAGIMQLWALLILGGQFQIY